MKEYKLFLNDDSRFATINKTFTCGDTIELYEPTEDTWLSGKVEADTNGKYYFTDGDCLVYLEEKMVVRY